MITGKLFALSVSILCQANTRLFFRKLVSVLLLTCSLRTERAPEVIEFCLQLREFGTEGLVNSSSLLSDV